MFDVLIRLSLGLAPLADRRVCTPAESDFQPEIPKNEGVGSPQLRAHEVLLILKQQTSPWSSSSGPWGRLPMVLAMPMPQPGSQNADGPREPFGARMVRPGDEGPWRGARLDG